MQTCTQIDAFVPPQNIEAEEAILCSCLTDPEAAEEFLDALRPEHFYRTAHQKIFAAVGRLHDAGAPVEIVSVAEELKRAGALEKAGGAAYVSKLVDYPPATDTVYFVGLLLDAHTRRRVIEIANAMSKDARRSEVSAADLLSGAAAKLAGIEDGHGRVCAESLSALCVEASDRYEALQKAAGRIIGVPTGFRDFDAMTCGLQPGDLIIIAARPSMGKTALALNMARHAAGAGYPVGFFSLEMSRSSLVDRLVSAEAGVNSLKFRNGRFSSDDWGRIVAAQEALHRLPIHIDDTPGLHYAEIRRRARRMQREHSVKLLFVDYLQLMAGDRQNGRVEEVSSISRNLKCIARELNVPVVCLSQLSRSCEARDNKRPRLSDLRDSGAIEQDADVVAFIYREEVYNREPKSLGIAELEIGKQRNGPTGMFRLKWGGRTMRFFNLEGERS